LATDYLILRARERGTEYVRINTEDYGRAFSVTLLLDGSCAKVAIKLRDGRTVKEEDITGVFFRQPRAPDPTGVVEKDDVPFARREMLEHLRSLWRMIPEHKWLNHPRLLMAATNKVDQLLKASEVGLAIPPTCISNDVGDVREFVAQHRVDVVVKAVKHGFYATGDAIEFAITQAMDDAAVDKALANAAVPMNWQRHIAKQYDIRLTLIGKRTFATAIRSQDHVETKVDWRAGDSQGIHLVHEPIELPAKVVERCRRLLRRFALRYAAIDLVLGQDGKYYFLEMNPAGQWAWIEQLTGQAIRDAILDELLAGPTGDTHEVS